MAKLVKTKNFFLKNKTNKKHKKNLNDKTRKEKNRKRNKDQRTGQERNAKSLAGCFVNLWIVNTCFPTYFREITVQSNGAIFFVFFFFNIIIIIYLYLICGVPLWFHIDVKLPLPGQHCDLPEMSPMSPAYQRDRQSTGMGSISTTFLKATLPGLWSNPWRRLVYWSDGIDVALGSWWWWIRWIRVK